MAKGGGGGFSGGGGFKGGGGGGFSSGGGFSPRPPRRDNNDSHNSGNGFLIGGLIGSLLARSHHTNTNTNVSRNEVFNDPSSNAPKTPELKYREYTYCEYCESEYVDLTKTKCENCGANLIYRKDLLSAPSSPLINSNATVAKNKGNSTFKKALSIFFGIAIALIIFGIVLTSFFATSIVEDYNVSLSTFDPNITYTKQGYVGQTLTSNYLSFTVNNAQITNDLSFFGLDASFGYYCVVNVTINNIHSDDLPIFFTDFVIKVNGQKAEYLNISTANAKIFNFSKDQNSKFTIYANDSNTKYFVFPLSQNYNLADLELTYREFDQNARLEGAYGVKLGA